MSNEGCEKNQPPGQGSETPAGVGADRTRRRLTGAGLAGAGVLMTVSSRTALGQVVGGCGSESASAALSRTGEVPDCGCSPGFWWNTNGQRVWGDFIEVNFSEYARTTSFNQVFCQSLPPEVQKFFPDDSVTLLQARQAQGVYPPSNYDGCANKHAVGMHAVAALLNVAFYGDRYPAEPRFSNPADVVLAFQNALVAYHNEDKSGKACSYLSAFKDRVDVYAGYSGDRVWCFNGTNWGD